ncbi:hypothetical protein ACE7GA_22320 [Roseomonas sp. CCTCC AB2023176]|uniref:hypothetical protein n=1 Tax=Roseomonas sp. CCTCC AB2023176 TaxID=3342640 RepID=UPI0035E1B9B3
MSVATDNLPETLPPCPEGRDWVGLLLDGGLLEAALDGLDEGAARSRPRRLPRPVRHDAPIARLLRLAGFRGAGAGGGGPGPRLRAGEAWA